MCGPPGVRWRYAHVEDETLDDQAQPARHVVAHGNRTCGSGGYGNGSMAVISSANGTYNNGTCWHRHGHGHRHRHGYSHGTGSPYYCAGCYRSAGERCPLPANAMRYYTPVAAAVPATTVTTRYTYPRRATITTAPPVQKVAAIPTEAYVTLPGVAGRTKTEVDIENRRIATERGAYAPRRIKPADAAPDDPFWCRERNGEWHLRSFYQIENECYPGRWTMDAEIGFLVFHRE